MNILLINHYAGSKEYGMVFRPYYLCREFVRMGHQVTIVAASFSHLRIKNPIVKKDLQNEVIDGIRYIWLKAPNYDGSGMGRVKNIITFVCKLVCYERRIGILSSPDLVIASSTYNFEIYSAKRIAKRHHAKLCYEIRDLWPLTPMLTGGYSPHHPFIWAMQKAENFALKHANKVVSLLWNSEGYCREHGLTPGKFVCIPNGYNLEEWTEDKFNQSLPVEHKRAFDLLNNKTIVGFAGSFALAGAIGTLINAAAYIKERNDIHFVLVGKGPKLNDYGKMIKEKDLQNVTILPPVPKQLVPAINKHFDIAYLGGLHSELHKYGTSANKMTDYMLCSLPIVHAADEPGSAVEREECGFRVEAENVVEVVKAIVTLADMTKEQRQAMGEKGKNYAKTLEWSILAKKFINVFE